MGEAKRKRAAIAAAPCRCGSGKAANTCCFYAGRWFKAPAAINLSAGTGNASLDRCYLRHLNSCSNKLSSEHLISAAVMRIIDSEGLTFSGLPWLNGEQRRIGINSLTGNCLCTDHNSALSDLDTAAANFFQAIKSCDLNRSGASRHYLLSGHDIERWMLKTLVNMAVSKNLTRTNQTLLCAFHPDINAANLLQDVRAWQQTTGLYFTMGYKEEVHRDEHFSISPLSKDDTSEICGMQMSVQGLFFSFFAAAPDGIGVKGLEAANYRPKGLTFRHPGLSHVIELSWDDNGTHKPVELIFHSTIDERLAAGIPLPRTSIRKPEDYRR